MGSKCLFVFLSVQSQWYQFVNMNLNLQKSSHNLSVISILLELFQQWRTANM